MEVHGRQPTEPESSRQRYVERQESLFRANRERVREARELLADMSTERQGRVRDTRDGGRDQAIRPRDRDVIEVSLRRAEADEARAERVAALKADHEAGRLNTPERVEQAAQRLLEG